MSMRIMAMRTVAIRMGGRMAIRIMTMRKVRDDRVDAHRYKSNLTNWVGFAVRAL